MMKHKIYKSHQVLTPHNNPSKYNTRKFTPKEKKKRHNTWGLFSRKLKESLVS